MFHISLSQLILIWMTSLQPSAPWLETYPETASEIASTCETHSPSRLGSSVQCAATMVSLAWFESRFDPEAVGDGGQSLGLFQVSRAWPRAGSQAATALRLVLTSESICRRLPLSSRLAWYASGGPDCSSSRGALLSRHRMALAASLLKGD